MKHFKQVILAIFISVAALSTVLVSILMTRSTRPSSYLDASSFVESEESKKFNENREPKNITNDFENSFLTNGFSNYALYNYKKGQTSINENGVTFSGNIDSYDNVRNDAMNVDLWQNDFSIVNIVIKTKDKFSSDKLTVKVDEPNGVKTSGGFLRFVKASNNNSNPTVPTFFGPNQSLWIPDAETESNEQDAVKDRVYIYRLRLDSDSKFTAPVKVNVTIAADKDKFEDSKQINVEPINYDLNKEDIYKDKESSKPGFDILDYPNDLIYYLNTNGGEYRDDITKNLDLVKDIKDVTKSDKFDSNDRMQYMNYNWIRYWEPEFKYHHDLFNEDEFIIKWDHDGYNLNNWSIKEDGSYDKSNLWTEAGAGNSLFMWKAEEDKDGILHPYLNDDDWEPVDFFIDNMTKLGYKKIQINHILAMQWFTSTYAVKQKDGSFKFESLTRDWQSKEGYNFHKEMVQQWVEHIKKSKANWVNNKDLSAYFYVDESYGADIEKVVDLISEVRKENNMTNQFMKTLVAYPTRYMDKSGKWTQQLLNVDVLYFYLNSLYDDGNDLVKDFINKRNNMGLVTGQYQLDATASFDLARADPGVLAYEMMLLSKQKEPNYLKYRALAINYDQENIESYDSLDYHESYGPYVAGDTMWEFPPVKKYKDWWKQIKDGKPIRPTNPSTRLENLAYGVNLIKKKDILESMKKIDPSQIDKKIQPVLTGSRIQHQNMFNFNDNKISLEIIRNGFADSYIQNYLDGINSKYGQIDALRFINNLLNEAAKDGE